MTKHYSKYFSTGPSSCAFDTIKPKSTKDPISDLPSTKNSYPTSIKRHAIQREGEIGAICREKKNLAEVGKRKGKEEGAGRY